MNTNQESPKYSHTIADAHAEDLADMAVEAGKWDEWQQTAPQEPLKVGRLALRREAKIVNQEAENFLNEHATYQDAMKNTPFQPGPENQLPPTK